MNKQDVRVRFAPSPTGGLHIGGVRTLLFNYLFAKKNNGQLILRIEDTDQNRLVDHAEQYIYECMKWCGIEADESVEVGGPYGPYKQSERKELYKDYALQLVASGHAYYAFDTPEELEAMRERLKSKENPAPQYDARSRGSMKNSLTLTKEETQVLIENGTPYVIRYLVPEQETIIFEDAIRGTIHHESNTLDDKVLLKNDGMPTYHLAVVVDDYLMKITHILRGEEWLPSAPLHVLLWRSLGWENQMPVFAHLPLILKPDGNGKLSKRDGERLGFPVFAMDWQDPITNEFTPGFKELGFLPEAFLNMLAFLGWNPGEEREIYSLKEMGALFTLERIHKGGAKFDFEKAKWFNEQHIKQLSSKELLPYVRPYFEEHIETKDEDLLKVIELIHDRCQLLSEFWTQGSFFFNAPTEVDYDSLIKGWNEEKTSFFKAWVEKIHTTSLESVEDWTHSFDELIKEQGIKKGAVMMPLRIMLVGGKFGPGIFDIAHFIGKNAVVERIENQLSSI